ncbi:MAG: DUF1385 domain-containing protein [Acidimicrobiia bacterium]
MRAPTAWAVAVRRPDGVIEASSNPLPRLSVRYRWARLPLVRGVMVLAEALNLGFRALSWSARKAGSDEEGRELTRRDVAIAISVALVFFVALFMVLPLLAARTFDGLFGDSSLAFNIIDGVVRALLFFGYIWAIGRSGEIRRVFEYHGAEHKTIHAYEAGDPLTVEAIQKHSPRHPRCGTNFLLIVILISLVLFTFVGRPALPYLVLSRIVLIPVVAAFSYELLKAAADHRWLAVASKPGIWLQRLTTGEPAEDLVEVAVAGLLASLDEGDVEEIKQRGPVCPAALEAEFG